MTTLIGAETGIKTFAAVHSQCRCWVKSTNYRAAASLSALPSISRPRQEGFDATLSAKTGREQMQQSRALFDKLVGGGKQ
jgi:hypothetical protein